MPRVSDKIPDSRVDFHRCGNNFGAAVVSMPEFSHKQAPRWKLCRPLDSDALRSRGPDVAGSRIGLPPDQIPGAHAALALDFDIAPLLQDEVVLESQVDILGDLNPADRIGGLHPRGDVDRVPP